MKVVFCWSHISGYMAACWRALAGEPGISLHVLAQSHATGSQIAFSDATMRGVSHEFMSEGQAIDPAAVRDRMLQQKPEAIVLSGWANPAYRGLAFDPAFRSCRFIMAMDTPRKHTLRQALACLRLCRFLRRIDHVVVAGERAWQYARFLGFREQQITRGVYGYDSGLFNESVFQQRLATPGGWAKRFLYMGRYAPEKGVDILVAAYQQYRQQAAEPWALTCCGKGPLGRLIQGVEGITDHGFVQPSDQPAVFRDHGALILPSRYEPWGVVVAEAMATGLPVICTEACGVVPELVRPYYSGLLVPTGNATQLCSSLRRTSTHTDELADMGRHAAAMAPAFASDTWAIRWLRMLTDTN